MIKRITLGLKLVLRDQNQSRGIGSRKAWLEVVVYIVGSGAVPCVESGSLPLRKECQNDEEATRESSSPRVGEMR
jgi:hypothetical protein